MGLKPNASAAMLDAMRSFFHLAFHVTDLNEARRFYGGVLGCKVHCTWASPSKPA
jgi:catechol-2,3-dioxygenase